jgi:hypothetical protein
LVPPSPIGQLTAPVLVLLPNIRITYFHALLILVPWIWMGMASSSKTLVTIYQTKQHHIPVDNNLRFLHILNVNSDNVLFHFAYYMDITEMFCTLNVNCS